MKKDPNHPSSAAGLRRRAEERLQTRKRTPQSAIRNPQSAQRLIHELQVHQIELEMQNEELRQARAQADALLAQYTDLYDFAPVGYLTLNEPGLVQAANLTAANLLGVARSKLLQRPLSRFILRQDADTYDLHRRRLFETRAPQSCELRMKRPDATPFWVRLDASVTPGSDDAAPVCRVTLSDITEHNQAEADRERLAQFERLAQLMKCASDIILLTDEHGRILEANDRALETYGCSLAELRQKTVEDLRTRQNRAELPHPTEQLETDGRAVFEAMHQRRDGFAFPVEISARFIEIAGVRCRLSIVRDITKRKQAEEKLRESEAAARAYADELATVLAATPAITFIAHERDCRRITSSRAALRLLRLPAGANTSKSAPPGERPETFRTMKDGRELRPEELPVQLAAATGQAVNDFEMTVAFEDGTARDLVGDTVPLFDAKGKVRGAVGAFLDVTERKRAEEKIRMFSQEIIAAREEERKKVASVLHHDVGSLTVGVSACLDVIEQVLRSGKPGEALQWMKRARKVFDASVTRLKGVAVQLRPPELDVLGLCAALRQHFAQITECGGIRIHFRETLGRRRVTGDTATTLFRIAQEALTNAVTHGHATRVDVGLSASKTEVALRVRNNGKAFNPSGKTGPATSHLGLRVMQEMAVSAGGVFTIGSGRGEGTIVRVRLPIAECGMPIAERGVRIAD